MYGTYYVQANENHYQLDCLRRTCCVDKYVVNSTVVYSWPHQFSYFKLYGPDVTFQSHRRSNVASAVESSGTIILFWYKLYSRLTGCQLCLLKTVLPGQIWRPSLDSSLIWYLIRLYHAPVNYSFLKAERPCFDLSRSSKVKSDTIIGTHQYSFY